MLPVALQHKTIDNEIIDYINELQNNFESRLRESEHKYLELKEQYDLLLYKRFGRSAEQLLADDKQQLLFTEQTETIATDEQEEVSEVKSYTRKKPGRKPLDPNLL